MGKVVILGVFVADTAYRADRMPKMGETILGNSFALGPGGKGSNQSVAAAMAGGDVHFITRLGNDAFADIALDASDRAAPVVADAVRVIGIDNALALVRGGPTAASQFLRGSMGTSLVEAMVPEVGQAMRIAQEPLIGQLLSALAGVDVGTVATGFADTVDDVIWSEIGREEAAIRENPGRYNDPLIMGVFGPDAQLPY